MNNENNVDFNNSDDNKSLGTKLFNFIFIAYFISICVFTPYYNWKYAQKHGFIKWLFFGEFIATGKAIVWPYFVFYDKTTDNQNNLTDIDWNNKLEYDKKACIGYIAMSIMPFEAIKDNNTNKIVGWPEVIKTIEKYSEEINKYPITKRQALEDLCKNYIYYTNSLGLDTINWSLNPAEIGKISKNTLKYQNILIKEEFLKTLKTDTIRLTTDNFNNAKSKLTTQELTNTCVKLNDSCNNKMVAIYKIIFKKELIIQKSNFVDEGQVNPESLFEYDKQTCIYFIVASNTPIDNIVDKFNNKVSWEEVIKSVDKYSGEISRYPITKRQVLKDLCKNYIYYFNYFGLDTINWSLNPAKIGEISPKTLKYQNILIKEECLKTLKTDTLQKGIDMFNKNKHKLPSQELNDNLIKYNDLCINKMTEMYKKIFKEDLPKDPNN